MRDDRRLRASIAGARHAARARGARPRRQGLHRRRRRRGAPGAASSPRTRPLPVIGVPIDSSALKGLDALLSTVQMPPGVPVATVSIGKPGATNAGVLAAQILARRRSGASPRGSTRTRRSSPTRSSRRRRSWQRRSSTAEQRDGLRADVKYSIVTFGCRVNQADSLRIEEDLRARGGVAAPVARRRSRRRQHLLGDRHRRSGRAPDHPAHRPRQSPTRASS